MDKSQLSLLGRQGMFMNTLYQQAKPVRGECKDILRLYPSFSRFFE